MSKQVRLRRGTTAQHSSFTGAQGEVTVDTDKKVVVVHDGSTAGGVPMFPSTGGTISGNITACLPDTSHSTPRGLKFGVTLYGEDYGGVTMRTDSGEVRCTAGYSGWGGFQTWYCNGVKAMELTSGGSTYNITGTYGSISDAKLKRDVTDATTKLTKVLAMRVVNYFLIADTTNTKMLGMIAQELREISPGLVDETPDYADVVVTPARVGVVNGETVNVPAKIERRPTGTTTLSIKYSVLLPMLVKAVQEMYADFDGRIKADAEAILKMRAEFDDRLKVLMAAQKLL